MFRVRLRSSVLLPLSLTLPFAGCWQSGTPPEPTPGPAPMLLAAGMDVVPPAAGGGAVGGLGGADLSRLGVSHVDRVYELETPAATPFAFDLLTRADGNAGAVSVGVAHVRDGRVRPPADDVATLAAAGLVIDGTGMVASPPWLRSSGDGFARLSLRGSITSEQLIAVRTSGPPGDSVALVRIALGERTVINRAADGGGDHPGLVDDQIICSSDSWVFGLPTVAVSGDRTSVVVYEGDQRDPANARRFEMRLQHDAATGKVTGGGSEETTADSGHWRDHEIAALFNVLAVAHCGHDHVGLRLSFDRGATFAQEQFLSPGSWATRLVQIAMAADYSLAVCFWRSSHDGIGPSATELVVVDAWPVAFDDVGSPAWFGFSAPQVVYRAPADVTPALLGAQWSAGGDLVIGHAFTAVEASADFTWTSRTEFHCAVRPWRGGFRDDLVDQDVIVSRDPSVSLLGAGDTMRVFYAYEGPEGVRLRASEDAGRTWSPVESIGAPGAHMPSVFARTVDDSTRVDLLFLGIGTYGPELHASRWDDWEGRERADHRLTTATMESPSVADLSLPAGGAGLRVQQVAWLGYDATLDGDELVVAVDIETFEAAEVCLGAPVVLEDGDFGAGQPNSPQFRPADPPPLAPGMTLPVPAPDPAHRHQLRLLRLK